MPDRSLDVFIGVLALLLGLGCLGSAHLMVLDYFGPGLPRPPWMFLVGAAGAAWLGAGALYFGVNLLTGRTTT